MNLTKKNIKNLKKCGFKVKFPRTVKILVRTYGKRTKYFLKLEGIVETKLSKEIIDSCKIKSINIPLSSVEFEKLSDFFTVFDGDDLEK